MTATAWELPKENNLAEPFLNFCPTETARPNKVTCLNLLSFTAICYTWRDNYTDYKKYNKEQEKCQKNDLAYLKMNQVKGIQTKNDWQLTYQQKQRKP